MPFRPRLLAAALLLGAGCSVSFGPHESDYDSDLALETLSAALDAWKDGDVAVLVTLDSPIRFLDDDLAAGFRLLAYDIDPTGPIRPFQGVPVTLTITNGNGRPITRPALYQVSLDPDRAVLRSDP